MRDAVLAVLAEHASTDQLAHVVGAKRLAEAQLQATARLPVEAVEELVTMLEAGRKPALGWWRRWFPPPTQVPPDYPPPYRRASS